MNGPKSVTAWFEENLATNCTPEWWLAKYYGPSADFNAVAAGDTDGDGKAGWQEYWANTDPTNNLSVFKLQVINKTNATGYVIGWTIGADRPFTIYFSTNYAQGGWEHLVTVPNSTVGSYTDTLHGTSSPIWYRGGVTNPCGGPTMNL